MKRREAAHINCQLGLIQLVLKREMENLRDISVPGKWRSTVVTEEISNIVSDLRDFLTANINDPRERKSLDPKPPPIIHWRKSPGGTETWCGIGRVLPWGDKPYVDNTVAGRKGTTCLKCKAAADRWLAKYKTRTETICDIIGNQLL
jgi:hypothetical protein